MLIDPKWLSALREQYPVGSRIRLTEMKDPHHPVEPGTMGTLVHIDDIGTFHMKWDNGRSLGLVFGEDRFSVLPPEPALLKLYMPMTVDCYEQSEYGDMNDEPYEMSSYEAVGYADHIIAAMQKERHPEEASRGLMTYYREKDSFNQKVQSYTFTAEVRNGKLWGVAECKVTGELTPEELTLLKENITGQAADGFGEGFEQRGIKTPDGYELYAHLWNSRESWFIETEQELFHPKLAEGLPETCFSVLMHTGELIVLKRGESGYWRSGWDTGDHEKNRQLADQQNERLGVTKAQEEAMSCGSMFGWGVPGADPKAYERDQEPQQMGGMKFE
jgi:hypothetical protein